MKTLIFVGSALLGAGLMFQMPTTPPMKMGLWETTSSTKMTGVDMPQGMTMPNMTVKARSCMTPESYAKNLGSSQRTQDCTRSNEVWTPKSYSFDISCKNNTTGHFEMTFDSRESGHAVMHMNVNRGAGHSMQMEMSTESHFVSADCGNITPDKPEIVH